MTTAAYCSLEIDAKRREEERPKQQRPCPQQPQHPMREKRDKKLVRGLRGLWTFRNERRTKPIQKVEICIQQQKDKNDSWFDETQTLPDSFTEDDSPSPKCNLNIKDEEVASTEDESTMVPTTTKSTSDDLFKKAASTTSIPNPKESTRDHASEKVVFTTDESTVNRVSPSNSCEDYRVIVSTTATSSSLTPSAHGEEIKTRVRFKIPDEEEVASINNIKKTHQHHVIHTSPITPKGILVNATEGIPGKDTSVTLRLPKQCQNPLDQTTAALRAAIAQLSFGDDVMDLFEQSQVDLDTMLEKINAETETSIQACSDISDRLVAGSRSNASCGLDRLETVINGHWQNGCLTNMDQSKPSETMAPDLYGSSLAVNARLNSDGIQTVTSHGGSPECNINDIFGSMCKGVSHVVAKASKVCNDCTEVIETPNDDKTKSTQSVASMKPLNHSWFSIDDGDFISKTTNPISVTLSNISLDISAITKIDENNDEHQLFEL